MAIEKVEGIVIGETLFGESSKILKVFTKKYGIISLMSKGCRKPKSNFREISNKLIYAEFDIKYKDNGISTLINASILNLFRNITMDYKSFDKKIYAFLLTDLTFQILNQKQDDYLEIDKIYDIYLNTLIKINDGLNVETLFNIVELKYLDFLGVKPSIDACSNCGTNKDIITLSSAAYGYICNHCYNNEKIVSKDTIKTIRMLYYVDISRIRQLEIEETTKKEIDEFLKEYYEEHTGIYIKKDNKFKALTKVEEIL